MLEACSIILRLAEFAGKLAGLPMPSVSSLIGTSSSVTAEYLQVLSNYYKAWKESVDDTKLNVKNVKTDSEGITGSDGTISSGGISLEAYDSVYDSLKQLLIANKVTDWQLQHGSLGGLQRAIVRNCHRGRRSAVEWVCEAHMDDTKEYITSRVHVPRALPTASRASSPSQVNIRMERRLSEESNPLSEGAVSPERELSVSELLRSGSESGNPLSPKRAASTNQ